MLYTSAANAVGNPYNKANLFIQQSNIIMQNSNADVTFSLAGVRSLSNFIEDDYQNTTSHMKETLDSLRTFPLANQLRNELEADLVVLLTNGSWDSYGIAFLDDWGNSEFGYAIAQINAAGGRFTFTHELAHLFGCKHNNDPRGAPKFNYSARGHSFYTGFLSLVKRSTLMNTLGRGNRTSHASNPLVNYQGKPTGTRDRNNVSQLNAMVCTVANYRDYTPRIKVNIVGPTSGNNTGTYTWCANISNCTNPLYVYWEYSLDGFNYSPWTPSGQNCITGSLPHNQNLWLRVLASCNDGNTDASSLKVVNLSDLLGDSPIDVLERRSNIEEQRSQDILTLYPNPVQNNLHYDINILSKSKVDIQLVDITGKKITTFKRGVLEKGRHSFVYDISNLENGYYFIKAKVGNKTITKSIIK